MKVTRPAITSASAGPLPLNGTLIICVPVKFSSSAPARGVEHFTGTKMINVPFKGNGPALAEVMAGRVTFMFYPIVGIADQVSARKLRVLGSARPRPHADFPT